MSKKDNYYIVRATSNVDGTSIYALLPSAFNMGEGGRSQDDLAICLDCNCTVKTWADHILSEPRLSEFVFTAEDIPSYLTVGCENSTYAQIKVITQGRGELGFAWCNTLTWEA